MDNARFDLIMLLSQSRTSASFALNTSTDEIQLWKVTPSVYEAGSHLVKIVTSTHFAFGQQSEDGQEVFAGGGQYSFNGSTYTEVIEYHSSSSLVGNTIQFDSRREGSQWYIAGIIGQFRLEETWHRLE